MSKMCIFAIITFFGLAHLLHVVAHIGWGGNNFPWCCTFARCFRGLAHAAWSAHLGWRALGLFYSCTHLRTCSILRNTWWRGHKFSLRGVLDRIFAPVSSNKKLKTENFNDRHPHIELMLFQWVWLTHRWRRKCLRDIFHLPSPFDWRKIWERNSTTQKHKHKNATVQKHQPKTTPHKNPRKKAQSHKSTNQYNLIIVLLGLR